MDPAEDGDDETGSATPKPVAPLSPAAQARNDRRAEALRGNLRRRKAQTRERAAAGAPPRTA